MHQFKEWSVGKKITLVIMGLLIFAVITFLFGFLVMLLWNWLMPDIFSLPIISYWQAWGLVILAHILFKGGYSHHKPWEHHIGSKWRSKFRQHFHDHFSPHGQEAGCKKSADEDDITDDELI
ncbi:MAG: hypothetical protein JXR70_08880 [Spirochaetales bacterium]|nr:hypothetical protein [Spirochaetales bacterium]